MPILLDYSALYAYCLAKPGTRHDFPFGPDVAVFRVADKMFALCNPHQAPLKVNLKCEPLLAELLREKYTAVTPGWHMSKRHWNTVTVGEDLSDTQVYDQIDQSYELIVAGLSKKERLKISL